MSLVYRACMANPSRSDIVPSEMQKLQTTQESINVVILTFGLLYLIVI